MLRAAFFFFLSLWLASPQGDQLAEQSRRGKELMSQGRFEDAIVVYRDMVKAMPGNPGLLLNLALAEQMAGHPDQAIPHFEAVLKTEPNSIPALTVSRHGAPAIESARRSFGAAQKSGHA